MAVLDHVFGVRLVRAFFSVWKPSDDLGEYGFSKAEAWVVPPGGWLGAPRLVQVTEAFGVHDERLPHVMVAVANDVLDGVLLATTDLNTLVALYDGGLDIFLETTALRDEARAHFAAWLSEDQRHVSALCRRFCML